MSTTGQGMIDSYILCRFMSCKNVEMRSSTPEQDIFTYVFCNKCRSTDFALIPHALWELTIKFSWEILPGFASTNIRLFRGASSLGHALK